MKGITNDILILIYFNINSAFHLITLIVCLKICLNRMVNYFYSVSKDAVVPP